MRAPARSREPERVVDGRVPVQVGDRLLVREELRVVHEQVDPVAGDACDPGLVSRVGR